MANRRLSKVPNAPKRIGFWATRRLSRLGRRDAKKYVSIQDTTATHAIKALEAQTHLNQRKVNEWLVQELGPLRVNFEVHRYFGWPAQAPSYKIGQRIWEQIRDEYAARKGASFDIKDFHREALNLGGLGLDTLRAALLG